MSAPALSEVAGILFAANFGDENLGPHAAFRVFCHWFDRMDLQRITRSSALNPGASRGCGAPQDHDRIIETRFRRGSTICTWSGFHTLVVVALGITWILDGLEVTLAGALSGALKESPTLHFTNFDIGFANSAYLAGAVLGALGFGWLTDRIGRKKLFFITLALYLTATAATALSWNVWSYALFRFLTGAGIGGEYTAINSTIQELVPARYRGWTDLVINGSFWIGAAIGAASAILLLDPAIIDPDIGWRLAYLTGACLGLIVFVMRMWIPESPRWLMIHGRPDEAHAIVAEIERMVTGHIEAQPQVCRRSSSGCAITRRCAKSRIPCSPPIASARWSGWC